MADIEDQERRHGMGTLCTRVALIEQRLQHVESGVAENTEYFRRHEAREEQKLDAIHKDVKEGHQLLGEQIAELREERTKLISYVAGVVTAVSVLAGLLWLGFKQLVGNIK